MAASAETLQAVLSQAGFNRSHGFRVESVVDGECTLFVPFSRDLERPGGVVAGASFMAAADAAMWLAILTRLGPADGSVTSELTTAFLATARQEDFRCAARVLKWGRRLIYGVAECVGVGGKLLTYHTVTYVRGAPATRRNAPVTAAPPRSRRGARDGARRAAG